MSHTKAETSELTPFGSEVSIPQRPGPGWLMFLLAIFLTSCASTAVVSGEAPFYAGSFEATCSPVDAPGVLLDLYRLGDPEPPMVSISVWELDYPLEGGQIKLRQGGYGAAFIGGTEWIPAMDGAVGFVRYLEGELASGWFWLELDGLERIEGQFEVSWRDTGPAICG